MNSTLDTVLARLGALNAADRASVVNGLPMAQRLALRARLRGEPEPPDLPAAQSVHNSSADTSYALVERLTLASPAAVAAALEGEPAWVVWLATADRPDGAAVRRPLPTARAAEDLYIESPQPATAAQQLISAALARRVADVNITPAASEPRSWWARWRGSTP